MERTSESESAIYSRERLYEAVWSKPLRAVASDYGVSDVAIAKTCRKLAVPLPGRGYWAKHAAGKAPPRLPLPSVAGLPEVRRVALHREPSRHVAKEVEASMPPTVPISAAVSLRATCPLVQRTIAVLTKSKAGDDGLCRSFRERCLAVTVSPASVPRSMRIMEGLIRGLETNGMPVEVADTENGVRVWISSSRPPAYQTVVLVDGEWCALRLVEKTSPGTALPVRAPKHLKGAALDDWLRWNQPRPVRKPNGVLELSVTDGFRTSAWKDGKRRRVEDSLTKVPLALRNLALGIKERRAERERWEAEWREAQRCREEAARRAAEEQARREGLKAQVGAWKLAKDIRELVAAVMATGSAASAARLDLTPEYLEWALEYADGIDPLTRRARPDN